MSPLLYSTDLSPPCRAVLMLAKAINLTLDVQDVKLFEGELRKPKFVKINPQHTIPTIDDNGFILWDSHAINIYFISKYAKNDSLYPKDIETRALIDQRLHFDSGVAFPLVFRIAKPIRLKESKVIPDESRAEVREIYEFLEAFLEGHKWMCGDSVTIADIHLVATISSIQLFEPLTEKYPNVNRWFNSATQEPWYEPNVKGLNNLKNVFTSLMNA